MGDEINLDNSKSIIRKFIPLPTIQFETNIVNHCNLNCKSCDHCSPLADEWFADIEAYEKDVHQMSQIFDGKARYIRLVGGEPLLHPNIIEFIRTTRESFNMASIEVWTNGLLLPKMSKEFWRCCCEHGVLIQITKYPIDFDYQAMKNKADTYSVCLKFFGDGTTVEVFNNNSFNLDGMCDPRSSFTNCVNANRHITLSQGGNLCTCDKAPHVGIFNRYFDKNMQLSRRDYINIYTETNANKIFEFLTKPIPFCRYCNIDKRMKEFVWERSKKEISEWADA